MNLSKMNLKSTDSGTLSNSTVSTRLSKVGDHSRGWPKGSLFNSYYTEV